MTQLVLVRHGQASFGGNNYDVLSPTGQRQAAVIGEHLARLDHGFDALYAGRMLRQQDTARLAGHADFTVDAAFDEYDFQGILRAYLPVVAREQPELGLMQDNPYNHLFNDPKLFQAVFEQSIRRWLVDGAHDGAAVETWRQFKTRVVDGLQRIAKPGRERVAVFTSGGVIAVATQQALGVDDLTAFKLNWRIANASLHRYKLGSSGLSLLGYNDITHLLLQKDPKLVTFR